MKRKSIITVFLLSICIVASWGCGGGPGTPGSQNTDDLGVIISASLVPTYFSVDTYSVDVVQQICQPGPPPTIEKFADHGANLTVLTRLMNPNPPVPPGNLYIEKYTIEYFRDSDSIGAPPIESDTRFETLIVPVPLSGTDTASLTATVVLVDLKRKIRYLTDMSSGQFTSGPALINNYTAVYTFEGKSQYGKSFSFKVQTKFQIGSFNYC